ncbi:Rho GTPase activation protein [Mycotypha africana]|uniref:Rho GTPase activation protein n=1 Tax=Mycotypha africana TaxID=64632 RepID=UPI00230023F2|nr:Rho GTPase activation protein [Mycotypha africana]KAI8979347.1 Rho GTPase activation protein [Mycotypha africana]
MLDNQQPIVGQLRIGALLEEYQVFPLQTYRPLMDDLTKNLYDPQHRMVYELTKKSTDVQQLAKDLLRVYEGMGDSVTWIKSLIDIEVASLTSDDVNILFRGNSFFTRVIDNFLKSTGRDFLEEAIQPILQRLCQQYRQTVELDTSRLSTNTTELTLADCTEIFKDAQDVWTGIQTAESKCPIELRQVFDHLQTAIIKKFDLHNGKLSRQYQIAQYTCVSGFIFLRWICPAIISPKQFGLVQSKRRIGFFFMERLSFSPVFFLSIQINLRQK